MDRFQSMQAFVRVAECGSFAEAARRLGVSRSVVSERVSQLEALVRATLLHRTTRTVRLSEAGERVLAGYRDLVGRIDDLENAVGDGEKALCGRLRISSVPDFGITFVAPALACFAERHPDLCVELITDNQVMNPIDSGFDIAIHLRQERAPDLVSRTLASIPSIYCAAPAYLAAAPKIREPRDLARCACINYSLQPNLNEWTFKNASRTERLHVRWRLASNSGPIIHDFVRRGLGVAVMPLVRVREDLEAGLLVRVLPDWDPPLLKLTATMPAAKQANRKAQKLLDFLSERLGALGEQGHSL